MQRFFLILTASSLLCACGETVETKSFYMENDAARKEKLVWCGDRPDAEYTNGNCLNAGAALQEKIEILKAARKIEREQRWDTRSSLIIEKEKCGLYENNETFKSCRNLVREGIEKKHEAMNAFNAETDALIEALK